MSWAIANRLSNEDATVITVVAAAVLIPAAMYTAMRPWRSTRVAQVRAATVMLSDVVFWGAVITSPPVGVDLLFDIAIEVLAVAAAVSVLAKGRRSPPHPPRSGTHRASAEHNAQKWDIAR